MRDGRRRRFNVPVRPSVAAYCLCPHHVFSRLLLLYIPIAIPLQLFPSSVRVSNAIECNLQMGDVHDLHAVPKVTIHLPSCFGRHGKLFRAAKRSHIVRLNRAAGSGPHDRLFSL